MKLAVIYASKYGATEIYARRIAEELDAGLYAIKAVSPEMLGAYDGFIYGGGLYAGGLNGLPAMVKWFPLIREKPLAIFTCGIADPQSPQNVQHIREELRKVLPAEMEAQAAFFHLRGKLDYKRLHPIHRVMMAMLRRMILKKAPDARDDEARQILETYGKEADFISRDALVPLVSYVRSTMKRI